MTLDPLVVIAFITALLSLLGVILRAAIAGDLTNPSKVVPRADYDALMAINADYPEAIEKVADTFTKLASAIEHVANGKS